MGFAATGGAVCLLGDVALQGVTNYEKIIDNQAWMQWEAIGVMAPTESQQRRERPKYLLFPHSPEVTERFTLRGN